MFINAAKTLCLSDRLGGLLVKDNCVHVLDHINFRNDARYRETLRRVHPSRAVPRNKLSVPTGAVLRFETDPIAGLEPYETCEAVVPAYRSIGERGLKADLGCGAASYGMMSCQRRVVDVG
ncbi:hypothetical protein, partial [Sulfitobacter sp. 1A12157]|uniref:hypothetical protein n=1 Tax=Sulfitobacter sp. 1A12157 TaxID=3368594 RepID=UPI003747032F